MCGLLFLLYMAFLNLENVGLVIISIPLVSILFYYFYGRFHTVLMDDKCFYIERFFVKNKIERQFLVKIKEESHLYIMGQKYEIISLSFILSIKKKKRIYLLLKSRDMLECLKRR